jgi:hypothetical protein
LSTTETLSPVLPNELEDELQRLLSKASEREIMLATAESCTGGMLASLLTDIPGVAHCFERGFVTYTDESKNELLGVSKDVLKDKGAVSQEVAIAMAEGRWSGRARTWRWRLPALQIRETSRASSTSPARGTVARRCTARSISARSGAARPGCSACGWASR